MLWNIILWVIFFITWPFAGAKTLSLLNNPYSYDKRVIKTYIFLGWLAVLALLLEIIIFAILKLFHAIYEVVTRSRFPFLKIIWKEGLSKTFANIPKSIKLAWEELVYFLYDLAGYEPE